MRLQVRCKRVWPSKLFAAVGRRTLKGALAGMRSQMRADLVSLGERSVVAVATGPQAHVGRLSRANVLEVDVVDEGIEGVEREATVPPLADMSL